MCHFFCTLFRKYDDRNRIDRKYIYKKIFLIMNEILRYFCCPNCIMNYLIFITKCCKQVTLHFISTILRSAYYTSY